MLRNSASHAALTAEITAGDVDDRCSKGAPRFLGSQSPPSQFSVPGQRFKTPMAPHGRHTERLHRAVAWGRRACWPKIVLLDLLLLDVDYQIGPSGSTLPPTTIKHS